MKSEKQWRSENDARTLAEAEKIKNDSSRLKNAQTAAKKMVKEQKEDLQSLSKVAQTNKPSQSLTSKKEPIKLSIPVKRG